MSVFTRMVAWFRPAPKTAEELEAEQQAAQLREEMKTTRLSQESMAGSNYETRRGSDPDSY
jgi:hypothetical protein